MVSQGLFLLQDSFGTEVSAPGRKEQANKGLSWTGGGGGELLGGRDDLQMAAGVTADILHSNKSGFSFP